MKVLLVQKVAGISGSENYLLSILPALVDAGLNAEFLCLYESKNKDSIQEFIERLTLANIKVHLICIPPIPGAISLYKISRFLKEEKYDLVHTNLLHADLILALTKFLFYRSLILVSGKHGFDEIYIKDFGFSAVKGYKNRYIRVARVAEQFINRSFAISKGIQNLFSGLNIVRNGQIDLIYYGFDLAYQDFALSNLRKSSKQILIIGRLVPYKGHELIIKSLPEVIKIHPDVRLVIVGNGFYEAQLRKLVDELRLDQYVYFEGHQKNVKEYLYNSDILAVPSIAEGFGIVFLEAFSQKKPVISFDVPAGNEIVGHNFSGVLVKPYDIKELSGSIISMLNAPDKIKGFGENGYSKLRSYYNLNRMVMETINFYQRAIADN
jgi:glycosyltransferase involved in cell wall biosynthesis